LHDERSVSISTDADAHFQPIKISGESEQLLRQKYGLRRPFVMYTGGIDHRKNIDGLIRAFSKLSTALRKAHQLAIVCSATPDSRHMLEQLAAQQGLGKDDLVVTGFVPEDDLLALYNLCTLFVFPSWHEGFGLPALEAMRCGAPVVGANTSSLPEVIAWEEAMFDPHSDTAMAKTMERALSDATFRAELVRNGKKQSAKFSWDESARRAIAAMERLHVERQAVRENNHCVARRPKLAYVSPLPPQKSGIADYSAELLPELARHYEIDVIVAQDSISDPWVKKHCPSHSVQWFVENSNQFDRVLYHFGNSTFHQHMFELLNAIPGVVVLHDFFLSGIAAHMDVHGIAPGYWAQELYRSHGYAALYDRFHTRETADVVYKYPCSLSVLQNGLGVISHSSNSLRLAKQWYGDKSFDWAVVPLIRDCKISANRDKTFARRKLGFGAGDFLVCTFGILGPTKLNQRLLQAWLTSPLAQNKACHLVFVGENPPGDYGQELLATIRRSGSAENIRITGWTEKDVFHQYLTAADVGVQLRTLSRGETSAAVLDCMNYGLATIVNANGSMADLQEETVWKLPDEFSDEQLTEAVETLWKDPTRRHRMGEAARDIIIHDHNPQSCADQYGDAIERFYRSAASGSPALPRAIAGIHGQPPDDADLIRLADAIARTFPSRARQRQILVDISGLTQSDACNMLKGWLRSPPEGCRVEPAYAAVDRSYGYARSDTLNCLECPAGLLQDEPIEFADGDVLIVLAPKKNVTSAQKEFCQKLRNHGVRIETMAYDSNNISARTPQENAAILLSAALGTAHD
jgi:glycosyltransferase involved in cell wall biosynthesis